MSDQGVLIRQLQGVLKFLFGKSVKVGSYVYPNAMGSVPEFTFSFPHGMDGDPSVPLVVASTGATTVSATDSIIVNVTGHDATNITVKIASRTGGTMNFPSVTIYWLAVA